MPPEALYESANVKHFITPLGCFLQVLSGKRVFLLCNKYR